MAAGPSSYGMTDTMGRMHSDAQFAGSSSVPAHVEMMGLIGMGNNPMVGATVACAVAVEEAMKNAYYQGFSGFVISSDLPAETDKNRKINCFVHRLPTKI